MSSRPTNAHGLPAQSELLLPLLVTLEEAGGELQPLEAMNRLAAKLGIAPAMRDAAVESGRGRWEGRKRFVWKNRVAWTRMNAVERDYIDASTRGKWRLTKKARTDLLNVRPGVVLKIYETANGTALWATAEAAAGVIASNSIQLVFTSPPYELNRPKAYGNLRGHDYINWIVNLGREWRRMLVQDGSLILNLGPTWTPGLPCQSEYQERVMLAFLDELKFCLAQRLTWFKPCALPTSPWVTQKRIRLNAADETLFWFGKGPYPYADTNPLLRPYSADHRKRMRTGRVSGQGAPSALFAGRHSAGSNNFADRGGSIPKSVLSIANSRSTDSYLRGCKELGIPVHGARMPEELAEQMILLTTRQGDVVYDPCSGSNVIGRAAEKHDRLWLSSECSLTHAASSALRFPVESLMFADSGVEEAGN